MTKKILIIGGDSRLGKVLRSELKKKNIYYEFTSRRNRSKNFLNLTNIKNFKINKKFTDCIILAGVTNYNLCENNKTYSRHINCKNVSEICKKVLKAKVFLCYVSTNTVINSKKIKPHEKTKPNANFEYAKQKLFVEKKILKYAKKNKLQNLLSILRLTKNVSNDTEPFKSWIHNIKNNNKIPAFDDLYFSPILFESSAKALIKIIKKQKNGIFHLSNELNLNYYQFAKKMFRFLNISQDNLIRTNSKKMNVKLIFKSKQSALSMKYTKKNLKQNYINIKQIFLYIKKKLNEKN